MQNKVKLNNALNQLPTVVLPTVVLPTVVLPTVVLPTVVLPTVVMYLDTIRKTEI